MGIYSAATRLSELYLFIPVIIGISLYPALVNPYKSNRREYLDRVSKMYKLYSFIGIFIGIFFTLFSKKIIYFLYGANYIESSNVLPILIWSEIFISAETVTGCCLRIENLTKYVFYSIIWGAVLATILNPIIKTNGIYGSAYALLISTFSSSIFFMFFYKETRNLFFYTNV